jgi:alpha-L-fucosidase
MKIRALIALAVAVLAAVFFSPAAQANASPRALAYPPTTCPGTLSVSTTHPLPGETITVTGHNFTPGANVHLVLHTVTYDLGTFKADAQGSFTAQVKLPDGVVGQHLVVAVSGAPHVRQCPGETIQIQAPGGTSTGPGGPPGTSFTGTDLLLILLAAAVLLGAGAIFLRSGRRRSEHA